MEREACCANDSLSFDDEIPWVTSRLYDFKREECQGEKNWHSFLSKGKKKRQYRRQSEPVISEIVETLSPQSKHQNKFALYSGTNKEFERLSHMPKGNMKQTFMHTKSAENSPQIRRSCNSFEKCFIVNLYIEAKAFHLGPFPFEIYPKMNVGLLKLKVEKELAIPTSFQKWILNKSLAIDNDLLLLDCGVIPGSPIFLYLDSKFEKSVDLDKLSLLVKISGNKSTCRYIDICHNTFLQYPVKISDHENIERFTTGNKLCDDNEIKSLSIKKCDKLVSASSDEHDRRKKKVPEPIFENWPSKSSSVKMESENIFPTEDLTAVPDQRKCLDAKKGPFKPVFAKVKEKESYTILNNKFSTHSGCSSKAATTDILSSKINSKNSSGKCQTANCFVAKSIFKSQLQIKSENTKVDSNVEKSNQSSKDEINVSNSNVSESEKHNTYDLKVSVPSSDLDNKVFISSSKNGQSSILEKVRMKNKIKSRKENENFCIAAENTQYIQNILSEDKIVDKPTQSVIDVNSFQGDILPQSKLQTECSNIFHDCSENFQSNNIENYQKMGRSLSNQKEEEKPDLAEISKKDLKTENSTTEEKSKFAKVNVKNSSTENLVCKEKSEFAEISIMDLQVENLTNSSDVPVINNHNTDAFNESGITEIFIINKNDETSSEIHVGHSNSAKNITELSNSHNSREVVQEEENEVIIKCAENYEHLLKMEDLNLVRNVVNFTCPVCFGEFESDQGVVLHECLHTFCIDCLARTIDYAEGVLVKCPYRDDEYSCQSYLQQREIKALVSSEIYERYLQRSVITAESLAEKSFHCKTPDCPGWCMFDDSINVFHCPVCFHYNCLNCRTIHEGLNCRQYQDKLQSQKKLDPDSEKTLEFLNKMIEAGKALKCPKCNLILMKKWGCDWLKCAVCLTEICWITKGPRWGPGGQGDTSGGCKCGVNGVKCHPSCTYCH
ncbi:unnamed protein product [Larinioides sclopetarius]|uniref:RBR-type E3 ubiquitin transferase n=1 Tax=Larinioides sclopetarius TaxID=280406 RepID=A0AAV1ZSV5_9ARAC